MELKNKNVVITGGTRGLGKSLALAFVREGSNVVVCAKDEEGLNNLPENILGIKADVTIENDLANLADFAVKKFGGIDIWINNAGIWMPHEFAENFDMDKVKKMFEVNVFGLMNGSRVALRFMKKINSGMIINIISDSALASRPTSSMYCASKWAASGFTKSIRDENKNFSVLAVYPGGFKTDIFGENKPDNFDDFMEVEYVAEKIVENLKSEDFNEELIVQK